MSTELKTLLTDLLTNVDPFKDVVTHIMVKEKDGKAIAAAKSKDGSISIMARSLGEVPGFAHVACLGSLPYLRSAINSSYMAEGNLDLSFDEASDGKTQMLRSIQLSGSNGFSVFYQAVDPFINKLIRIKNPAALDYPVAFVINDAFISNFDEIHKVHMQAPKMGTDLDDIFTLAYDDGKMVGLFGERGHSSTVTLTDEVEVEPGTDKVNAMLSISRFRSILKLVGKNGGAGFLSDKALKVDTETRTVGYEFVTTAKKVRG